MVPAGHLPLGPAGLGSEHPGLPPWSTLIWEGFISFQVKKKNHSKNGGDERFPREGTSSKRKCLKSPGKLERELWLPPNVPPSLSCEKLSIWGQLGFLKYFYLQDFIKLLGQ